MSKSRIKIVRISGFESCSQTGQSLLELVIGLSLISVVIGALAIITTYSLRNTQFSKNQSQATKLAQENLEKIKTIKSSNYGICFSGEFINSCSGWDNIWIHPIAAAGEKYTITTGTSGCTVGTLTKPYCLQFSNLSSPIPVPNNTLFSSEIIIYSEPVNTPVSDQRKIVSRIYWTDNSGTHTSDLVTVLSRY